MISKREAKFIKSLHQKKFRSKEGFFVVEGEKNVIEVINSNFKIDTVYASQKFLEAHNSSFNKSIRIEETKEAEISSASFLTTNTSALAVVHIPKSSQFESDGDYTLAFENLQDPGNLGTIIRTADWYGFKNIVCSLNSVDCYNPKVIAATMGSFARVNVHYLDLEAFIKEQKLPVYGALLSGDNIHTVPFKEKGILLFGNESKGLSETMQNLVTDKVLIKGYGGAESLNVGIATAVFCDNLRRELNL